MKIKIKPWHILAILALLILFWPRIRQWWSNTTTVAKQFAAKAVWLVASLLLLFLFPLAGIVLLGLWVLRFKRGLNGRTGLNAPVTPPSG